MLVYQLQFFVGRFQCVCFHTPYFVQVFEPVTTVKSHVKMIIRITRRDTDNSYTTRVYNSLKEKTFRVEIWKSSTTHCCRNLFSLCRREENTMIIPLDLSFWKFLTYKENSLMILGKNYVIFWYLNNFPINFFLIQITT